MIRFLTSVLCTLYFFASAEALAECGEGSWKGTECKTLKECKEVTDAFSLLQSNRSANPTQFLMARTCGFDGIHPKVCCPVIKHSKLSGRTIEDSSEESSSKSSSKSSEESSEESSEIDSLSCGNILWSRNLSPDGHPTDLEEFPWLALLEYQTPLGKTLGCGGVLISDRHILTAAQCLDPIYNLIGVRLGEHNVSTSENCVKDGPDSSYCSGKPIVAAIEKRIPHENYSFLRGPFDFNPESNDIAILKLNQSVIADHIKPICLPKETADGRFLQAGWGARPFRDTLLSIIKRMSRCKSVDRKTCEKTYLQVLQEDVICALSKSRKVACIGDYGGPLMGFNKKGRMTVYGIHSPVSPIPCLKSGVPTTYIDVKRYRKWILSHLKD